MSRQRAVGEGGDARVYGQNESTIVRILRGSIDKSKFKEWVALVKSIHSASHEVTFSTPQVLDDFELGGRFGTIERRFPGQTLKSALSQASDEDEKISLVLAWLNAAYEIQSIRIDNSGYGDLLDVSGKTRPQQTWYEYWQRKLSNSLNKRGDLYKSVDVFRIARAIPEPQEPALVHLDIFSGNLLWHEDRVSAVLDFGASTIMGDSRLTPLFAAAFIMETDSCKTKPVIDSVNRWLIERDLFQYYQAGREMQAACWSFVSDVRDLDQWCRQVLLQEK